MEMISDTQQIHQKIHQSGPLFSIVTVLYNSNETVFGMLKSVPASMEIILVDNGDTPPEMGHLPNGTKYLKMDRNIGFGRACNRGAREATGEFLLFLNPDVILYDGFFEALDAAIKRYSDCSVFCAATYVHGDIFIPTMTWIERQLTDHCMPAIVGARFFGDCCVRFANGGAFSIRRSLFLEIGGFDPNMFLYFEDDDLSWRLLQRGQPIILVSNAKVDHALGTSTPPSRRLEFLRGYGRESSIMYLRRKYRLKDKPVRAVVKISRKIIQYAICFNIRRLYHQVGRIVARIERVQRVTGQNEDLS